MTKTIIGIIISAVISSILSIVFSDQIIRAVRKMLFKIGFLKDVDLTGKWLAVFTCEQKQYTEVIEMKTTVFGTVVGNIAPGESNYDAIKKVAPKRPRRLKGTINDNRYFTGFWYHPVETSRFHGAFQMLVSSDTMSLTGQWIGYSQNSDKIESGEWSFIKIVEE